MTRLSGPFFGLSPACASLVLSVDFELVRGVESTTLVCTISKEGYWSASIHLTSLQQRENTATSAEIKVNGIVSIRMGMIVIHVMEEK